MTATFYPHFAELITVTFKADDDTDPLNVVTMDKGTVIDPAEIPIPEVPTGQTFRGWFTEKTPEAEISPTNFDEALTASATYYAVFEDAES